MPVGTWRQVAGIHWPQSNRGAVGGGGCPGKDMELESGGGADPAAGVRVVARGLVREAVVEARAQAVQVALEALGPKAISRACLESFLRHTPKRPNRYIPNRAERRVNRGMYC